MTVNDIERIHAHDIIEAWEQFDGEDVTAFYAEWDRKLARLHAAQRHEQPHLLVEFTVEEALGIQQALDEWYSDPAEAADALAEHLQAVLEKLK